MKREIILSAFFLVTAISTSLASGQSDVKETREVKNFTKVSFGVAGNLYINI
jgi:hypothetical protein